MKEEEGGKIRKQKKATMYNEVEKKKLEDVVI